MDLQGKFGAAAVTSEPLGMALLRYKPGEDSKGQSQTVAVVVTFGSLEPGVSNPTPPNESNFHLPKNIQYFPVGFKGNLPSH